MPPPRLRDLIGDDVLTLDRIDALRDALGPEAGPLDLSGLVRVDMAGAWFLATLGPARLTGAAPGVAALIDLAAEAMPPPAPPAPRRPALPDLRDAWRRAVAGLAFFGRVLVLAATLPRHPQALRLTSTVHHLRETGLSAIPIVALMAFLIGVVLAFQGAAQLRQFGAQVFVVDLIAISVLRELGVLLTAIIVAGRSGAAFTAAIGSMKMREEVDALRTLGLDPVAVLALPRILALVLALPLLTVAADVAGLVGGAAMAWAELGVTPGVFAARMEASIGVGHYLVGLVKAPAFALIVGLTGCWFGLQVGSDAESLGRMTSRAVVVAIFLVIVADAAFSILFAVLGV
ncbi:ABC transporter permease [Jannaschia sp. Os4]|uniref:MlaE family ABC transporter permease n=1 Tax=Jannaschia sp. Os4 TaxID=2807617 RepID=UPI00193ACDA8|nr:ABC transporter permease [Jannaschia sp. Os4]MBM2576337.1 ABC transporter permease [Jannaschia sp. Os4]